MAKRPKSPGVAVSSCRDFLGQTIIVGDHVIIAQRDGNHDRMWSAEVFDINTIEHVRRSYMSSMGQQLSTSTVWYETKLLVQPTGAYRGSKHVWPTELDRISGEQVISDRPRMSWIDAEKAVRSPVRVTTVVGTSVPGFLTEPQEIA